MTTATIYPLRTALIDAQQTENGGLGFHVWAVMVDRDGMVASVCYSGAQRGDQWPGGRIIAAMKAGTANSLSLDQFALSTANLYSAVQPGGPLFGLADSLSLNIYAAYGGDPDSYGADDDSMIGKQVGGFQIFAGGLALYDENGHVIGGLGVSGDLSCADHNIAWKVRHALDLDYLPAGASDNIVYDIDPMAGKSKSGWGHPTCNDKTRAIGEALIRDYPPRRRQAA